MRERGRAGGFRQAAGAARAASPAAPRPGRPGPLRALRSRNAPHLLQGGAALTPREARRRPGSRRMGLARHHGAAAGPGGPARLRDPRPRPCAASAAAAGAAACQAASRRVRAGPSVHRGPRGAGAGLSETELPRAPNRNATRRGPQARRRPARTPPRPGSPRPSARRGAPEAAPEQNGEAGRADAVRRGTGRTRGQQRRRSCTPSTAGASCLPSAGCVADFPWIPKTSDEGVAGHDDVIWTRLLDWKDRAQAGQVRDSALGGAAPPDSSRTRGSREDYSSRRPARRAVCERSLLRRPLRSCASATRAFPFCGDAFPPSCSFCVPRSTCSPTPRPWPWFRDPSPRPPETVAVGAATHWVQTQRLARS